MIVGAMTFFAFFEAQLPVGAGWVNGRYYDTPLDEIGWAVVGVAGMAALAVSLLTYSVSQWRWVLTGRRLSSRTFAVLALLTAIAVALGAVATTRDFCSPMTCPESSAEMH